MFDIITIGSATKDIFLEASNLKKGNQLCFPLGQKIELKKIMVFSGGGGVNCAATFALQGLKTAFCGVVGQDLAGREILDELGQKTIDTTLIKIKSKTATDIGLIFHSGSERTILLYHSASRALNEKDIDWQKLKETNWLYLAPLWESSAKLTEKLISFVKEKRIKVAVNPSIKQLTLPKIRKILPNVDVLILNDDEAAFLAEEKQYYEDKVFKKVAGLTKAMIIVTKGRDGAAAFDGRLIYQIGALPVKVVDATGAGDSFGSAFVAGLIQKKDVEESLRLAMANAISNIQVFGANRGLLKKGDKIPEIKITKKMFKVRL